MSGGLGRLGTPWSELAGQKKEIDEAKAAAAAREAEVERQLAELRELVAETAKRADEGMMTAEEKARLLGALEELSAEIERVAREATGEGAAAVGDDLIARMKGGLAVKRGQAATYLGVSVRHVQRMEASGKLRRCPNLGGAVRYSASDVLKLASARLWKED